MKYVLMSILLSSGLFAGDAWLLELEYSPQGVKLLSKKEIQAKLKKSRLTQTEEAYYAQHANEFGWILKDSTGKVIMTDQSRLPGKIHADFAEDGHRHDAQEIFKEVDTLHVVIPQVEGSTLEFLSRKPLEATPQSPTPSATSTQASGVVDPLVPISQLEF